MQEFFKPGDVVVAVIGSNVPGYYALGDRARVIKNTFTHYDIVLFDFRDMGNKTLGICTGDHSGMRGVYALSHSKFRRYRGTKYK